MSAPAVIAWGAFLVLIYAYFGYPLLLLIIGRLRRMPPLVTSDALPRVTMVIAAWNEENVIARKLDNALSQSYPQHLLDVIVVSDGSTDATDEIAAGYAERTKRVTLLRTSDRQGKSGALNVGVPAAAGDIVVLTDANAMFAPDAVASLVRPFADDRIGVVSGQLHYVNHDSAGEGEGAYWRYEQRVKRAESALGALLGANGSIYAIRREFFRPLRHRDVDDFRIPYEALLRGSQAVIEPAAESFEPTAGDLWAEYRRKVRIMATAIPMMLALIGPTLVRGRLLLLWQLISHKVLREIQGLFFLGMLIGSGWGTAIGDHWLLALLMAQIALLGGGAAGWARSVPWRVLKLAAHYDMIVIASLAALGLWVSGRVRPTWQPSRASAAESPEGRP